MDIFNLKEFINITKGKKVENYFSKKSDGSVRFIQIDDLRNDNNLKFTLETNGIEVKEDDLIIAWDGANAGTIGFGLKGVIGSTLARLRITDKQIYYRYFGKYLQSKFKYLRSKCTGATIPHISKNVLENLKIPLPSLEQQKQIADILDKALSLRQKRKQSIQLLDDYLKSVFYDMFGDPVKNEKRWEIKKLEELIKIERNNILPENIEEGMKYIDLESIEKETGKIKNFYKVSNGFIKSNKFIFSKNHILYGKLRPYLNKVALPDFNGICSTDILPILTIKNKSVKYFISFLLRQPIFVNYANERSSGANLPRVNVETIYEFNIIAPPINLQNQFAQIVGQVEQTKSKMEESLKEINNLFNSLMNKSFKK